MQHDEGHAGRPTRRQLIAAGGASALALTAGMGSAQRPALASGLVFEDRSGTGRRHPNDPGIAGVMVSNGRDVTLTDADGRWRLPVAEGDSLFVIKPAHWTTPCGPGGIPRFSHLHQPAGTPADADCPPAGVATAGPLPVSIDFPLRRQTESLRFEALLLADTQPADDTELGYLRDDILAGTLGSGAAFAINHGDVVFDDLSLYKRYLRMLDATGLAWHHCPGNHDMNLEAASDRLSRETWKQIFGARHYAFQHAGATFILLDNVYYFGRNPGTPRDGQYCGLVGEAQLQFVRAVLGHVPLEQLIVMSMHIPLVTYQDPANPADNTADRAALLRLLRGRPHTVSFSGHMHLTEHHYLELPGETEARLHHHHVLSAASGGWWGGMQDRRGIPFADSPDGNPNGYHVLSVEGSRYETRFVAAAGKDASPLRAVVCGPRRRAGSALTEPIPVNDLPECELVVNVFDGGPRTRVVYELAGHDAAGTPMRRVAGSDPFVAEALARTAPLQRPWVRPVPSSHLWRAPLPKGMAPGAHRLTIRIYDEYGRRQLAHMLLEVSAPQPA
jgi:hypothetical protein